jgi:hypothetical protein
MACHRLLPLLAALALAPHASAQPRNGSVQAHYLALDDARFGTARMDGFETGVRAWTPTLRGGFAIGADYVYTHYSYEGLPTRDRDLHRLTLPVEWSSPGATSVTLAATPTVATSSNVFQDLFSRGTADDFELYASVTVQRRAEAGWGWRLGAAYDDSFGDPEPYPVAAVTFASAKLALELGWPRASAQWQASDVFDLGIEVAPAGARWHVVSDERAGADFDYLVEAWRAALVANWRLAPRWNVAARIGSEFDRHHDFEDDTGARIDADAQSAAFAAFALAFDF